MRLDSAAPVLIRWHNVEVSAADHADRSVIHVGVFAFDCIAYRAHRCLSVPPPLFLSYHSSVVLRLGGPR